MQFSRFNFHSLTLLLSLSLSLLLLAACTRTASVQTLEQRDLMRLVFKGWDIDDDKSLVSAPQLKAELPASAKSTAPLALRMQALHVQKLDENNAVLLVKGEAVDAGLPSLIAAYWFHRRSDTWSLTKRQDVVEWLGASGRISKTSVVELFPGNFALAVEHSHVENNEVAIWLRLFRIGTESLSPMMEKAKDAELLRHYESGPECENMMRPPKGKHSRLRLHLRENDNGPPNCYDYLASWEMLPGTDAPGIVQLTYSGKSYRYQELGHTVDGNGERIVTYDLQVAVQKGRKKMVMASDTQMYILLEEPLPARKK